MIVHYDTHRWIVRCDGVHAGGIRCTFAVEGPTEAAAAMAAKEQGMTPLAGGRWRCTMPHEGGVS